jgi:adenine-specific DNA-methyltransferase
LRSLARLPEFRREFVGKVKLAYIDPPFNTAQTFEHYEDNLEHSIWLTMMRDRLDQIQELLAPDGTVWVHLNDNEVHRCRVVLDELFLPKNYVGTIVWEKKKKPSFLHGQMATITDFILVYAADRSKTAPFESGTSTEGKGVPFHNKGNPYRVLEFPAGSVTFTFADRHVQAQDMSTAKIKSVLLDDVDIKDGTNVASFRMEGEWRFGQAAVDEMIENGDVIRVSKLPFRPNHVRVETTGKKITNVFSFRVNNVPTNEDAKEEIRALVGADFDTPKPEGLMARIIDVATDPGDLVLDCFAGTGTTAAVAQKMGRRWVVVERRRDTIESFLAPRLQKVIEGEDPGGVTDETGWEGGSGFRVLDVAPSMFEADEDGAVFLADWATNGALQEATAAQLGFEYEEDPPFSGRKGRSRLAVLDSLASPDIAEFLVSALDEGERLVLHATAIDPETAEVLRRLRPGSTVSKIPSSILAEFRRAHIWWPVVEEDEGEELAPKDAGAEGSTQLELKETVPA